MWTSEGEALCEKPAALRSQQQVVFLKQENTFLALACGSLFEGLRSGQKGQSEVI